MHCPASLLAGWLRSTCVVTTPLATYHNSKLGVTSRVHHIEQHMVDVGADTLDVVLHPRAKELLFRPRWTQQLLVWLPHAVTVLLLHLLMGHVVLHDAWPLLAFRMRT